MSSGKAAAFTRIARITPINTNFYFNAELFSESKSTQWKHFKGHKLEACLRQKR